MIDGLTPYPEYKDSGHSWIGKIPSHWKILPNRALFKEIKERGHVAEEMLSVTIKRGVIKQKELLSESSKKDSSNLNKSAYKLVCPDDIVYNKMRAWQGAIGISKFRGIVSPAYIIMRLRNKCNPHYFHYLFRTSLFAKEAERWSYGITSDMWSLRPEHYKMIYIPMPTKEEINAIVRYLDHITRILNREIREKQKEIKLLNEQKMVIICRAVTRGINLDAPLKPSGISWLGDVPKHWEFRRAKQVCLAIIDCKNRTPDMVPDGGYTVVRTTNIRGGRFYIEGSYPTDKKNYNIWTQRGAPQSGDVFFTREAPAGEACLVPKMKNLCMGQRMMYFRPNPAVLDAEFFVNSIYGPSVRSYITISCNGSTVGHLRLGQVRALPFLWCPVEEQKSIVRYINKTNAPINNVIALKERQIQHLINFHHRLITDVITGKLDVVKVAEGLPDSLEDIEEVARATENLGDEIVEPKIMAETYG